jgi:hypothetical protein
MYMVQGCDVGAVQQRLIAEWYDEHTAMLEIYEAHEERGEGCEIRVAMGAGRGWRCVGVRGLRRVLGG